MKSTREKEERDEEGIKEGVKVIAVQWTLTLVYKY
jgi:hypothetical protein